MLSLVSSHRFALAAQLYCVPDGESRTSPQHHPLQRHYRTKDPTYFHKGRNTELWLEQNTKHFRRPPSPCCPRKKVWCHPKENIQADHSGWPLKSPLMALYTQALVHTCIISVYWNKNKTNANTTIRVVDVEIRVPVHQISTFNFLNRSQEITFQTIYLIQHTQTTHFLI